MATSRKRLKIQEESTHSVWLRLCDPFIRTDGNLICPIIKAETSIRVLFRLQEKTLVIILHNVYHETGMKTLEVKLLKSSSSDSNWQAIIFIQCESPDVINEEKLNHFKERLRFHLSEKTTVRCISIDQVDNMEENIPQPMISEPDFEMHKLEHCYKSLSKKLSDPDETDATSFIMDGFQTFIDECKEKRTKIAILSQNGKGKSFLLNLLFLLTIDNEEEYQNNNKKLKLPTDITGDPTIEELGETIIHFPDVVKDVLKTYKNSEKFKTLMESMYFQSKPPSIDDTEQCQNLFLSLPNYFKGGRIVPEPYILPQKNLEHSNESTTKCIIHLRYGTVYQIKVDYFSREDLKQQLFELVSLSRTNIANADNEIGLNKKVKDKAYECLQTRFAILTDTDISEMNEKVQSFNTYRDIVLSEEVEKFAGRTELYIGSGRNATEDRLTVKAILKGLTSPQNLGSEDGEWKRRVAAVKEIVVYVPSKFLYGGKEILEMPGTDDSDALALDFIDKALSMADAVFVLSEFAFNIAEKEVKDILTNSEFIQKWKKFPELSSLMLLTYPEKDAQFQVKQGDTRKIETIKSLEGKRRSTELKQLCEFIEMQSLPQNMDAAVFSSYIMPVLHTSIHAQEGTPHEVIQEHASFLECTGIKKLIIHLDKFISLSRKMDFQQMQKPLTTKTTTGLLAENARVLLQMYKKRLVKHTRQINFIRQYEELRGNLEKNLTQVYTSKLEKQVADTLADMAKEALQMWDVNEENITSIGAFNPYFCGNNPTYKVRICRIILDNLEDLTSKIFAFVEKETANLLKIFEEDSINFFAQELNSVLDDKNIDSRIFVEQSIQDVLSEARQWYIGRQIKPINQRTVGKCLKDSKKVILKKYILTPAYKQSDLDHAKQLARKNIAAAVNAFKIEMRTRLLDLHDTRWNSFCIHLKGRRDVPKPWQVLLSKLKDFCESTNTQQQKTDNLSVALKLFTTKNPK